MSIKDRLSIRRIVHQPVRVIARAGSDLGACVMVDVSATGARLAVAKPAELPDDLTLVLSRDMQVRRHCKIRWRSETEVGVQFVVDSTPPPVVTVEPIEDADSDPAESAEKIPETSSAT